MKPRNRIEGFSITANLASCEDEPRGMNDVTVYRADDAKYKDGYGNRMYTDISMSSYRRVLRAVENLIVTRPDWRTIGVNRIARGIKC